MKRLIPTAVVGFAIMMLMLRGFGSIRGEVSNTTAANTTNFDAVDTALQSASFGLTELLPLAMLVAALSILLYGAIS